MKHLHNVDSFGRTALHVAARKGCVECIGLLLDHGAMIDVKDSTGDTPLHVAASHNHLKAMEALYPTSYEDESTVESVDAYQNEPLSTSFYGSPREHCPSIESNTLPHRSSFRNPLNDSGYFSARSNSNAWVKTSYYNKNIPNKIEEERESVEKSSLDSISDTLTVDTATAAKEEEPVGYVWIFAMLLRIISSQWKYLINPTSSGSQEIRIKTEPPDHVRDAMERYKLSRQKS